MKNDRWHHYHQKIGDNDYITIAAGDLEDLIKIAREYEKILLTQKLVYIPFV